MNRRRTRQLGLAPALAAGVIAAAGCAVLPKHQQMVEVTPVRPSAGTQARSSDGPYQSAINAMERRDYASALDNLQIARARKPDDVRVLNAFGVVYDKLGRFDLSARYYAQASALEPKSEVVAQNLAYSAVLQAKLVDRPASPAPGQGATLATAPSGPAPRIAATEPAKDRPVSSAAAPPPRMIALAAPWKTLPVMPGAAPYVVSLPLRSAGLIGRALVVINASGRPGGTEPLRIQLARKGWTAPKSAARNGAVQARTVIRYSRGNLVVARALARTLPTPPPLLACGKACQGLQLVVGADSSAWPRPAGPRRPATNPKA